MSISRQVSIEPSVRGYSVTHPPGKVTLPTEPGWSQLLYTASGAMTVSIINGSFMVPPNRALWLPDDVRATVANRARRRAQPVLREQPGRTARHRASDDRPPVLPRTAAARRALLPPLPAQRCSRCPVDRATRRTGPAPLRWNVVAQPNDPRAINFLAAARTDPGASTAQLAASVATGRRTVERIFFTETHHAGHRVYEQLGGLRPTFGVQAKMPRSRLVPQPEFESPVVVLALARVLRVTHLWSIR
jgi:hypothetical protein